METLAIAQQTIGIVDIIFGVALLALMSILLILMALPYDGGDEDPEDPDDQDRDDDRKHDDSDPDWWNTK